MKVKNGRPAPRTYSQTARAQSTEETARRIVEAFLSRLMSEWFDEITLDRIAGDADVTVQTVVRRFGGKEGLLESAVKVLATQIVATRAMPSGDIDAVVANLFADYEKTGDAILRLLALEPRHPVLKTFTDLGRREHRQWVSDVLGERLMKLAEPARQRAIDALVIVTDVYAWKLLRRDLGRSLAASIAITRNLIRAVIADLGNL
jgi:AcrR family transcriptional regulator